jgi:hypothetical protein
MKLPLANIDQKIKEPLFERAGHIFLIINYLKNRGP